MEKGYIQFATNSEAAFFIPDKRSLNEHIFYRINSMLPVAPSGIFADKSTYFCEPVLRKS